jgi:hypothetical protein
MTALLCAACIIRKTTKWKTAPDINFQAKNVRSFISLQISASFPVFRSNFPSGIISASLSQTKNALIQRPKFSGRIYEIFTCELRACCANEFNALSVKTVYTVLNLFHALQKRKRNTSSYFYLFGGMFLPPVERGSGLLLPFSTFPCTQLSSHECVREESLSNDGIATCLAAWQYETTLCGRMKSNNTPV